jgi:hypothetical protein
MNEFTTAIFWKDDAVKLDAVLVGSNQWRTDDSE